MNNKYYTPKVEEFHVGFEYEEFINFDMLLIRSIDHEDDIIWIKTHLDVNMTFEFMEIPFKIMRDCIRVKYLDKEDIEDLGFKFHEHLYGASQYFYKDIKLHDRGFGLSIYSSKHIIDASQDECLFNGLIKNKSELKVLLKQLNIS
jgi:hypothetical protein